MHNASNCGRRCFWRNLTLSNTSLFHTSPDVAGMYAFSPAGSWRSGFAQSSANSGSFRRLSPLMFASSPMSRDARARASCLSSLFATESVA